MKTTNKSSIVLVLVVLVSLTAGFLVGILVDFPKTDNTQLAGTIGRVQNYKNVKVTEADLELKNDLVTDTLILKAISTYFNYYYVSAVSQEEKIRYALDALENQDAYKEYAGLLLQQVAQYATFLENARLDLLQAIAVVTNPAEVHPVMMRNTIVQANNVISQISYRKQSVLDLTDNLGSYLATQGKDTDATLASIHTVLTMEQISNALALNDKVVLKYFEKKKIFTEQIQGSFASDLQGIIVEDAQKLGIALNDIDPMGMIILNSENIGNHFLLDNPGLNSMLDNMSELGYIGTAAFASSQEMGVFLNMDDLSMNVVMDTQQLEFFADSENLGMINSIQELGFLNINQLNFVIRSSELGIVM
ncbi:MAG: hypothetical protein PHT64_01350 [Bacteroidales bacterium]|nr:hypothetical protein [Bacteroidales bacterium]MDD3521855.1 hypothetical protein [Bacteroidales bacterium]MDD4030004.1 hypothetical protein [Bacteroidales bacterium]MDD4434779.1 hypothetical protein [Bacteroidales bacterium]MDD5732426.1 hypothetical protein [Bacteroidales bacterium]